MILPIVYLLNGMHVHVYIFKYLTQAFPGIYTKPVAVDHLAIGAEATFSTSSSTGCRRSTSLGAQSATLLENHSWWTLDGCKKPDTSKY